MDNDYEVIVLGGGPAGLTAGIYLGRAKVKTLVLDSGTIGGQTVLSFSVANYPGVAETSGRNISQAMLRQAREFGSQVDAYVKIKAIDLEGDRKIVELKDGRRFAARAVIVATGGIPRKLGLESEEKFAGRGISYCATCDGDFFAGKPIAVIGGGNSALEEALALTKYASRITIIHEFDHFQAQPWIVAVVRENPKMSFLMEQDILSFEGGEQLEKVVVAHKKTRQETVVSVAGCFVLIGYVPNSSMFTRLLDHNERGEILANEDMATNVQGVFVAGDVRAKRYRQITTAVADGTVAALSATEFLGK